MKVLLKRIRRFFLQSSNWLVVPAWFTIYFLGFFTTYTFIAGSNTFPVFSQSAMLSLVLTFFMCVGRKRGPHDSSGSKDEPTE